MADWRQKLNRSVKCNLTTYLLTDLLDFCRHFAVRLCQQDLLTKRKLNADAVDANLRQ